MPNDNRVHEPPPEDPHDPGPDEMSGQDSAPVDVGPPGLTDLGNARRLADRFGRDIRFCPGFGGWMIWDGMRWMRDELCRAKEYAKAVPNLIAEEAQDADDDGAKALRKWLKVSESLGRQDAMVKLASSDPRIACRKAAFDANRDVVHARNGTINLRTAEMWGHRREDLITRQLGANLNPLARCPLWDAFLLRAMGGDADLVAFVQRAVGYSLLGTTEANAMFILWGNGANGKSTFVEVLRYVFGDYATDTPAETFVVKTATGGATADIAALDGARLVTAAELGDGKSLDEALIKRATGGDPMTARFLYGAFFTFAPQFALWMSTNHRPIIRGVDEGIWRRLKLIPWTVTIPVEERDLGLGAKLQAEADGILAWALRGLLDYLQVGLHEPAAVTAAVTEYRAEMDMLSDFLAERTVKGLMSSVLNADLYKAYASWARDIGETNIWSHRRLSREMQARGWKQSSNRESGRRWVGLDLVPGALPKDDGKAWGGGRKYGEA